MTKNKKIIIAAVIAVAIIAGSLAFAIATGNNAGSEVSDGIAFERVTDESGNAYWVDEEGNPVDESELPPEVVEPTTIDTGSGNNYAPGEAEYEFDVANGDSDAVKPNNSSSKNFESTTFTPPSDGKMTEADAKTAAQELLELTEFADFGYSASVTADAFKFKSAELNNGAFEDRDEQVWTVFYVNKDDGSEFFFELNQTDGSLMRYGTY